MHYKINDLLKFIRDNDNSGLFKDRSNSALRKHIRACLNKGSFFFWSDRNGLYGITEWYRVVDFRYVIKCNQDKRHLNNNPTGSYIWIDNTIFKPGRLTNRVFNRFKKFHKNISGLIWWRFRRKRIVSCKVNRPVEVA